MNVEVANRLQQLRKAKGLSQEELANILGLSRQAISKWERAETSPDTDNLICLAKLYNISIDKLLDTSESMEEIKERIAQERIDSIDKEMDKKIEVEKESIDEETFENSIVDEFSEEENELKKVADEKMGRVILVFLGLSIAGYLIIGYNTHDWSWGWILIVQTIFGVGVINGLYEEKQFSVISFFFFLAISIVSIKWALEAVDSLVLILSIIQVSIISFCCIIAFISFLIFASKNRKDLDIMYHKKRYIDQRDKLLEVKGKLNDLKKDVDKMNK